MTRTAEGGVTGGDTVKTILICEDDDLSGKLFVDLLGAAGYCPLLAVDGREALDLANRHRPDLITLDFRLRGMDGEQVVRRLKADPATRHIPVLAVTARAMAGDREHILAAGCDGYIAKPVSIKSYLQAIAGFLGPAAHPFSAG